MADEPEFVIATIGGALAFVVMEAAIDQNS
jgi:hypothetical protein